MEPIRVDFGENVVMYIPTDQGYLPLTLPVGVFDLMVLDYVRNHRERYVQTKQVEGLLFDDTGFSEAGF